MTSLVDRRDVAAVTVARGAVFAAGLFPRRRLRGARLTEGDADRRAGVSGHLSDQTADDGLDRAVLGVRVAAAELPVGKRTRGRSEMYTYQVAVLCWPSRSSFRVHAFAFRTYVMPGIFLLTVAFFAAPGWRTATIPNG